MFGAQEVRLIIHLTAKGMVIQPSDHARGPTKASGVFKDGLDQAVSGDFVFPFVRDSVVNKGPLFGHTTSPQIPNKPAMTKLALCRTGEDGPPSSAGSEIAK